MSAAHEDFRRIQRSQPLLGTFVVIAVYGTNESKAEDAISSAFAEVRRLDGILSLHRADSELVSLNRNADMAPVPVSDDLFRVLQMAQEISERTGGSFDITIRPLAELWGFIRKDYRLPNEGELRAVLPYVNYKLVTLDATNQTVRLLPPVAPDRLPHESPSSRRRLPTVSLDLGGIAKGYIVDRVIELLAARGFTNALVRAGGDLRVSGAPPGQGRWDVQLEDPKKKGRRTRIPLRDSAISTSGDYENYFEIGGKRYAHLLNPRTGLPVEGIAACSVIAPTCVESDALATALFALGPERAAARFGDEYPTRFILSNGRIAKSRNFP